MDKWIGDVRLILALAVLLDYFLGDPPYWPHPIRYIGWFIKKYEQMIRRVMPNHLKTGGYGLVFLVLVTVIGIFTLLLKGASLIHPLFEKTLTAYFLYAALAAKCLEVESKKVYTAIDQGDLEKGRQMLSYLVGRDTTQLSSQEVTRGAVETVAENTVDGVLAPLFYMGIGLYFGFPVQMVFCYKAINTLDSMVGYIQEPYREIGFASAKLDDIVNYLPARLGALLMLGAGLLLKHDWKQGLKILKRDKRNHKSPNCAYPESAVAGLLNIQLGGTNTYFGHKLEKPTIGDSIRSLEPDDVIKAINIMYGAEMITVLLLIFLLSIL